MDLDLRSPVEACGRWQAAATANARSNSTRGSPLSRPRSPTPTTGCRGSAARFKDVAAEIDKISKDRRAQLKADRGAEQRSTRSNDSAQFAAI